MDKIKNTKTEFKINVSSDSVGTPFSYTLSLISGKWKMIILYLLSNYKSPIRYNELHRKLGGITYKTLSRQLKELEQDNLIIREAYPQIPPKVEYSLSSEGESLIPILNMMCKWGQRRMDNKKIK